MTTTTTRPFPEPGSLHPWRGWPVTHARTWLATHTTWPTPCARCRGLVDVTAWHLGHRLDRQAHPELTWEPSNWQVEHPRCSTSAGAAQGNRRRPRKPVDVSRTATRRGPALPGRERPGVDEPGQHPDGFTLPRVETPPRPNTDYSLAEEVLAWIDGHVPGPALMPWQRYVIRRGFETADHRLWRQIGLLVSRQQGKTFLMQRVLMARSLMDWFGADSAVLNTHQDYRQAVELLEVMGRELPGYLRARANGADWWLDADGPAGVGHGRVWRARAQTRGAITGLGGTSMAFIDELQDARPEVISRTVRPLLSSARVRHPQVWFAGTGERVGSEVLRQVRAAGADGGSTLWLEWSAPPGCDTGDEVAWRWASPDWSPARRDALLADLGNMPEEDFRSEYLVQHLSPEVERWLPPADTARCSGRVGDAPAEALCAVESTPDGVRWSVAAVWPHSRGRVRARVWLVGSLAECVRVAGERRMWVHLAVRARPELGRRAGVATVSASEARAATSTLRDAVTGGLLTVAGVPDGQWAAARTVPADGGDVLSAARSVGDIHAVKALSWAVWALQSEREHSGSIVM